MLSAPPQGTAEHPSFGGVTSYRVDSLSRDPDQQVAETLARMEQYVVEDARSPQIQQIASQFRGIVGEDERIAAAWSWARESIQFTEDKEIAGPLAQELGVEQDVVEVLIRPRDMADMQLRMGKGVGDCDDFSMYLAAILVNLGVRVKWVTVSADPVDPSQYTHVYLVAYTNRGDRVPLDASHGKSVGWETRNLGRIREWEIGAGGKEWLLALVVGTVLVIALQAGGGLDGWTGGGVGGGGR